MDAVSTARAVLNWVTGDGGALPAGPLDRPDRLATPPREALDALADLTRLAAARLGAGHPPFGDLGPVSPAGLLLAAVAGGRTEPMAVALAEVVPELDVNRPGCWVDLIARHAVAEPILASLPPGEPIAKLLLCHSPLTALLSRRPVAAGAVDLARRLLARPCGAAVLVAALAAPDVADEVVEWRARLLSALLHTHPGVVLDVHVAARLLHAAAWDAEIRTAEMSLSSFRAPTDRTLAVLRYWSLLDREAAGRRPFLTGHERALRLVARYGPAVPA